MHAPTSDWTGLARRLWQRFAERAAAANTHNRFVAGNYTDLKGSDTPTIILGRGSAGNDAAGEDPAIHAAGAIARRAHARHQQTSAGGGNLRRISAAR